MSINEASETPQEDTRLKEILNKIPAQALEEIVSGIVKEKIRQEEELAIKAIYQQFSGPIPPPQILSGYDQVQAGFAERIVAMAEKEQSHRHGLENQALNSSISIQKRGQIFALLLSLLILAISGFLIYEGKELAGSALAGATLTGLAYIFITGRKDKHPTKNAS
jgi:uncharacterized membrane protein